MSRSFLLTRRVAWEKSSPSRLTPWLKGHVQRRRAGTTGVGTTALDANKGERERVVILGSGWAGYGLSRRLNPRKYQVLVVSPRSYFVFTPLLNSTAVGTLEFRNALEPVRSKRSPVEYFEAWANEVDFTNKTVRVIGSAADPWAAAGAGLTEDAMAAENGEGEKTQNAEIKTIKDDKRAFDIQYDKLVIAVGCYSHTFNTKGVQEHAFFMKSVGDARKARKRILECFETANLPTVTDVMRKVLLHFAIVGGGPTGMEFAAELSDLIHHDLSKLYPELVKFIKVSVYDVAPRVLSTFDERLARYAMEVYKREGIEIKTSHHVEELRPGLPGDKEATPISGEPDACYTLRTREDGEVGVSMCIWSTGNMVNPFVRNISRTSRIYPRQSAMANGQAPKDPDSMHWRLRTNPKGGALLVDDHLRVQMEPADPTDKHGAAKVTLKDVFALGDNASFDPVPLPATAQSANQQALWLGKRLNKGDLERQTFSFKNMGIMTYLGGARALIQIPGDSIDGISGRMAWLIWRGAYLTFSVSWRNKTLIPIYWFLNWAFGRDISRF